MVGVQVFTNVHIFKLIRENSLLNSVRLIFIFIATINLLFSKLTLRDRVVRHYRVNTIQKQMFNDTGVLLVSVSFSLVPEASHECGCTFCWFFFVLCFCDDSLVCISSEHYSP